MTTPRIWIENETATFWGVFHAPASAFGRNPGRAGYLLPLCVLGLLFAVVSILQAPLNAQWAEQQLRAGGAGQAQLAAGTALMWRIQRWSLVLLPLLLLLRWVAFAAVLWMVIRLIPAQVGFGRVLSVIAYSYFPILLRDATVLLVLWMRPQAALLRPDGMNVAIGMNLFLPRVPPGWWTLAGNINVFELWYVALLTIGISRVAETSRQKGLLLILPVWGFVVALQSALVSAAAALRAGLGQ